MKTSIFLSTICFIAFISTSCGTSDSNVASSEGLRKQLSFSMTNQNSDFSIGTAYGTRISSSSQYISTIIPITNNSSTQIYCLLKLADISYLDKNGSVIHNKSAAYVNGQVQSNGKYSTVTCLKPRQSGYFILIDINDSNNLYDNTVGIIANSFQHFSSSWQDPPTVLQEQPGATYSFSSIRVPVKNIGTRSAQLDNLSRYILFDASNKPVYWGFFEDPSVSVSVLVPGSTTIYFDSPYYKGSSTVSDGVSYISYQDASSSSSSIETLPIKRQLSGDNISQPEYLKYLKNLRNLREMDKAAMY